MKRRKIFFLQILLKYCNSIWKVDIYIPKKDENKKSWGENTTTKEELKKRNEEIMMKYNNGSSIKNLAGEYYLTEASIRRIIRELKDTA